VETFGQYKYRILQFKALKKSWYYEILNDDESVLRQSEESFEYEGIARFAAIGHISMLEQGKG
jgi:hypothetical protein